MAYISNQWISGKRAWHPVRCSVDIHPGDNSNFDEDKAINRHVVLSRLYSHYKCINEDCLKPSSTSVDLQQPPSEWGTCDNCSSQLVYQGDTDGEFFKLLLTQEDIAKLVCELSISLINNDYFHDQLIEIVSAFPSDTKLAILKKVLE